MTRLTTYCFPSGRKNDLSKKRSRAVSARFAEIPRRAETDGRHHHPRTLGSLTESRAANLKSGSEAPDISSDATDAAVNAEMFKRLASTQDISLFLPYDLPN
jgi:hypothetical protein